MLSRERFSTLQRLIRQLAFPRARRASGVAWIEGPRGFIRAVDFRRDIHTLVLCERLLKPAVAQMMVRRLRRGGTNVLRVSPEQFRAISQTQRASGIGAIVHQHWTPLESLRADAGLCWVAVSRIRSPGNLGTILRTAEAAGAAGLVVMDEATDPFDPAVLRGSMGSVLALNLARATLPEVAHWARRSGASLVGTSPRGCELFTSPIPRPAIVLLGEERAGLTEHELAACTTSLRIPMVPASDSINVAVASGIVLFELRRRESLLIAR